MVAIDYGCLGDRYGGTPSPLADCQKSFLIMDDLIQTLMGVVKDYGGLLATRLFLGVAGT